MQAKLVALAGPLRGEAFPLPPLVTTIGSDPLSHITWADTELEEEHAHIAWREGRHVLIDLASASGTTVNGRIIHGPHVLNNGDEIRIGASLFRYEITERRAPESGPPPVETEMSASSEDEDLVVEPGPTPGRTPAPNPASFPLLMFALIAGAIILLLLAIWVIPGLREVIFPPTPAALPPPSTATHTSVGTLVPTATFTSVPQPRYYPVPVPINPPDGAVGSQFLLQWSWRGALAPDEWYSVWVWQQGESPHSLAWTKEPQYMIPESIGSGIYSWQVIVVQGVVQGSWQRDLSSPSETRHFTLVSLTPTVSPTRTHTPTTTPSATPSPSATFTPVPLARVIVSGRVYDGGIGLSAPLGGVEVRVYLGGRRAETITDGTGHYLVEFVLAGQGGAIEIELLATAAGFEQGIGEAILDGYTPGTTQEVAIDVGLFPAPTPTRVYIPPTSTLPH